MKRNLSILIILFVAVIAFPISEFEKYISNAKIYYENGEFDKVISELKEAVQIAEKDNQKGMVEALQYLAFSYVAYDDYDKAELLFKDIFKIDPEFSLDRDTTSPKILGVYDKAKIGYLQMRADEAKAMKDAAAKKAADDARIQKEKEEKEAQKLAEKARITKEKEKEKAKLQGSSPYQMGYQKKEETPEQKKAKLLKEQKAKEEKEAKRLAKEKKIRDAKERAKLNPDEANPYNMGYQKKEETEEEKKERLAKEALKKEKAEKKALEKGKAGDTDWGSLGMDYGNMTEEEKKLKEEKDKQEKEAKEKKKQEKKDKKAKEKEDKPKVDWDSFGN